MRQDLVSMRPGTIFGYKGDSWKVIANDTLLQRFTAQNINHPKITKSWAYHSGASMMIRWSPTRRI